MKVTFLGAGAYGKALGELAKFNDHEVKYYDPIVYPEVKLSEAVADAEVIVYVAPAEKYEKILPELPEETPLILASKGFISMKPFSRFKDFSVVGGAAFAATIIEAMREDSRRIYPIILTSSSELAEQLFTADLIQVEYCSDAKAIMLCGALKNVYAIGGGMFMLEEYPEQYLIPVYEEFQDILEMNGCDSDVLTLSCGMTDLMISCTMDGRNFRFGDEIRMHPESRVEPVGTIEGLNVIRSLDKFPDFSWWHDDEGENVEGGMLYLESDRSIFGQIVGVVKNATK